MGQFLHRAEPWVITLVQHNWPILIYAPLILWSALRVYARPSRPALLALYGMLVLALTFEYGKHGAGTVQNTVSYLLGLENDASLYRSARFVLSYVVPIALNALGLALLIASIVWTRRGWPPT